jgi:hypothetical protein
MIVVTYKIDEALRPVLSTIRTPMQSSVNKAYLTYLPKGPLSQLNLNVQDKSSSDICFKGWFLLTSPKSRPGGIVQPRRLRDLRSLTAMCSLTDLNPSRQSLAKEGTFLEIYRAQHGKQKEAACVIASPASRTCILA